jgi:hypothetical protein
LDKLKFFVLDECDKLVDELGKSNFCNNWLVYRYEINGVIDI